ncbi:type IV pilus assembly protein PilM [Amphibacillus marinus]|uniref:Type IV pilus assembly protein PilM n=1 Tax=Amphibacillus marinus TaxID=872970 RepID=A0A1H8TSL8_9BACI|nr:pilus assembly protein PilM [Amphibacillus marinus]SEO93634.1 type IV pilus assembly protein PilM [Amphibacillus marinus]
MGLIKRERVYIMLSDRLIRYMVSPLQRPNQISDYGEVIFDSLVIEDGRIINEIELKKMLKRLIDHKKWRRRKLSFIVPDSFLAIRTENIPKQLSKEEAKHYIKLQLEGSIRLPFKNPVLDFQVLDKGDEQNDILLFAYPTERIMPYYQLFEQLGLEPDVADVSSLSIYRTYKQADLARKDEHLLMIQFGKNELVLTVFHQDVPMFNRHISFSNAFQAWKQDQEKQTLVWSHSLSAQDEFIDEQLLTIERFMDFYQYSIMDGQAQITDLLLTGDFTNLNKVSEQLELRFDLPVKPLTTDPAPEYAALLGLIIKGETTK